jgi:hypothetical protein
MVATVGAIALIISFAKDFKELKLLQKIAICCVAAGTIVPFVFGFINGMLN